MNKLDAISQRGKGMRALVRLIKAAITGFGACVLIASSAQLRFGGITYALENTEAVSPHGAAEQRPVQRLEHSPASSALDENVTLALFPEPAEEVPAEAVTAPVRPGVTAPDGWSGDAVSYDAVLDSASLYGIPVAAMTAMTEGGIPAQSDAVSDDYFADAVFIGNSLLVGMQKAAVIDTTYYASIGLSVKQCFDRPNMPAPDGAKNEDGTRKLITVAEALAAENDFTKVYLMFGINELGWVSADAFIETYALLIDTILTIRPDTVIYVQKILPINDALYAQSENAFDYINSARIAQFNEAIADMASRKQVLLLDPGTVIADENGQLPADATTDGIHLNAQYIARWADYLRTHTVPAGTSA